MPSDNLLNGNVTFTDVALSGCILGFNWVMYRKLCKNKNKYTSIFIYLLNDGHFI